MDSMMKAVRKTNILSSMEEGTEGAVVLVGALDEIKKPVVAFVRLAEAIPRLHGETSWPDNLGCFGPRIIIVR